MRRRLAAAAGVCAIALLAVPATAFAVDIPVNTNADGVPADDGSCTLREAILAANTNTASGSMVDECPAGVVAGDSISFDVGTEGDLATITVTPTGELPAVTEPLTIDGTTQCNPACVTPKIEINGFQAADGPGLNDALQFGSGATGSVVKGLIINNAEDAGIRIGTTGAMTVEGNWIGTDETGAVAAPNGTSGIHLAVTDGNTIGGSTSAQRNVISGNGEVGVTVSPAATNTVIKGNYVGIDPDGELPLPNGDFGLDIGGDDTIVGGSASAGEGNVISGQSGADDAGIMVQGIDPDGTQIKGNRIGTNAAATLDRGNHFGIRLLAGTDMTTIGGTTPADRNVISGNNHYAVEAQGSNVTIRGNYVGTTADGTSKIGCPPLEVCPNIDRGVHLLSVTGTNLVGGDTAGAGNLLSGISNTGIQINGDPGSGQVSVQGNLIGTNADGDAAIGNGGQGIRVDNRNSVTIGGPTAGAGNVVAASADSGIRLDGTVNFTTVQGNLIGTDLAGGGGAAFGNGATPGSAGLDIVRGSNDIIGGTTPGEGNTIANTKSGGAGILVRDALTDPTGNSIRGNEIFDNSGLGIDLGGDGVTANDAGDADTGPNNLQNFPVLTSVSRDASTVSFTATLNSTPSTQFNIDVYASETCDPSGNGEGEHFVGTTMATTDGSGNVTFMDSLPTTSPATADQITFTATRTSAPFDTSEFSACFVFVPPMPPSPGPSPTPFTPTGPLFGTASLGSDSVKLKKNTCPVQIACQAGGPACNGAIELKTAGPVTLAAIAAKKRKKKVVPLGNASFSIPAGQSQTVRVPLTKQGRKLFKKRAKVRAKATITTGATATASLLIKKPKRKK